MASTRKRNERRRSENVKRRTFALLLALCLVLSVGAAACGGDDDEAGGTGAATGEEGEPQEGGTLRVQTEAFEWTGNFDPTGEYLGTALGLYTNMLTRTLMGYRHMPGDDGNELVPDLAESEPEVSEDGTTYTYTLRDGVNFGPPLSRPVTSKDVAYAFKRIGTESLVAQYGFYYNVIEGMEEFTAAGGLTKKGNEISGIETPDDKTITFTLTQPTGDFNYRVGMPAAGPIPEEVASCFTKAGEYGRFVISSGPYMIEGSDQLDASSCGAMKAISGFNPNQQLILVRNPDWDKATDEWRPSYIDRLEWTLNTNAEDIFNRIKNGTIEAESAGIPPEVAREYTQNEDLQDLLKVESGDRTWYLTMNLTQPPFDDIHVRKAVNWIMDKEGLRRAWGGSSAGEIAHHIVPDTMFNNDLEDYQPYKTEGDAGNLEEAKAEMMQSKYDSNQDGVCDAPECNNVLHVTRNTDIWVNMEPVIEQALGKIGIKLVSREFEDSYTVIQTVKRHVPISSTPGWGKDYADASTFMVLFDSRSILPEGNVNYSLVGITPEQAEEIGAEGTIEGVPSVDADIDDCNAVLDADERNVCWQDLDKKLMEEVVPWVPYLDATNRDVISEAVVNYTYDQFSGEAAWSRLAVDQSKQN
jgi:peptide/nickel transport system substrate-binding protein